jgi:ABC-type transport system substrate-binding protein
MKKQKFGIPLMAALLLLGGGIAGYASLSSAQTTDATATTTTGAPSSASTFDPAKGGHVGTNGVKEALLTGDLATRATQAALLAVPGATIERVETDAEGAAYEAHIVKSDGSHATVKFDSNFTVTATETGPGPR